jgi:hypothetical protein
MAGAFSTPRALTTAEIHDLVRRYATTARIVTEAGFDGVQLHGAHGYLISQFLSPLVNQRDDEYGGDAVPRRRFLLELVAATRDAIGADRILSGVRAGRPARDRHPGGVAGRLHQRPRGPGLPVQLRDGLAPGDQRRLQDAPLPRPRRARLRLLFPKGRAVLCRGLGYAELGWLVGGGRVGWSA